MHRNSSLIFILFFVLASCQLQQKVKTGLEAYQYKKYFKATQMLPDEIQKSGTNVTKSELSYYLAKSYQKLNKLDNSLLWMRKSIDLSENELNLSTYAYLVKQKEAYREAALLFQRLSNEYPKQSYKTEYLICSKLADDLKLESNYVYTIEESLTGGNFNDYSPCYFQDNFLVFSSDRPNVQDEIDDWTGLAYSDLFIQDLTTNTVKPFDDYLNTDSNEGTPCLTQDYKTIYFTRCQEINLHNAHCRIYRSNYEEGRWSEDEAVLFFDENINVGHPALMENDSVMVFSAGPANNSAKHDLYYAVKIGDEWSQPFIMSSNLNTDGAEKFPTVFNDTLYYSSDGLPGLGGLDVFKTYLTGDNTWSTPENLPSPINSGADDFSFIRSKTNANTGFFSSARSKDGFDRLYSFKQSLKVEDPNKVEPENPFENQEKALFLAINIVDENRKTKKIPNASLNIVIGDSTFSKVTNRDGFYIQALEIDTKLSILVSKNGYFSQEKKLHTSSLLRDTSDLTQTLNLTIPIEQIKFNEEIVLDNIYYDYDESFIREDAKPTLDELASKLVNTPNVVIILGSHTDCRGEDDYNEDLSKARASAAVDYLISKGVKPNQLQAKGYGENAPSVYCVCTECTEEEHQSNRRTTFRVIQ